jgi:hypothetical protein
MAIPGATDAEKAALKRMASLRAKFATPIIFSMAALLLIRQISNDVIAITLAIVVFLIFLSSVLYISLGLRCPRCASWIPLPAARSKCISCGLRMDVEDSNDTSSPKP